MDTSSPKVARKRLFGSASSATPCKVVSITGYLVNIGLLQKGETDRSYFELQTKTGE